MNRQICIRVSEETYKYLEKLAKVNKCTISEVVRWKIEKPKTFKELRKTTIRETQG